MLTCKLQVTSPQRTCTRSAGQRQTWRSSDGNGGRGAFEVGGGRGRQGGAVGGRRGGRRKRRGGGRRARGDQCPQHPARRGRGHLRRRPPCRRSSHRGRRGR